MKLLVEQREDGVHLFFRENILIKIDDPAQPEILQAIRTTYDIPFVEPYHPYAVEFDGQVRVRYEYHDLSIKDGKITEEWVVDTKKQWDKRILTHRKRKVAVLLSSVDSHSEHNFVNHERH